MPAVRERTPFGRQSQLPKFLKNAGFYLMARNAPPVQVVLISGYWDSPLETEELEFSLNIRFKGDKNPLLSTQGYPESCSRPSHCRHAEMLFLTQFL